jgi:SAC3 family protein LENG8/THP3
MYSAMPGSTPWQQNGAVHGNYGSYIPVQSQSFNSSIPLPPPPTYVPAPLPNYAPPPPPPSHLTSTLPPHQQRKKPDWSPSIREYVQRSFVPSNQIEGIEREDVEVKLKSVITAAKQNGTIDSIDWSVMPLPQQMLLEERKRSVLAPPPPIPSWLPGSVLAQPPQTHTPPQETLRKRKSSELTGDDNASSTPPWRQRNGNAFEDRVTFASNHEKRQKKDHIGNHTSKFGADLESRKKRFEDTRSGSNSPHTGTFLHNGQSLTSQDTGSGPIVGRSQKLEKNYFRLTSAPNPDDVRPLELLRKTLDHLKKKWRKDANYTYTCDQLKSLRQDLTVQHIKNEFTTEVYEIHARIALEKGDLGEYNQCQTQLRELYKQNLGGHPVEFKAYRILYFIHTCNRSDMNDVLSDLTPADKQEPAIKHALAVRSALALGNYHQFFKLYLAVPQMGAYLMDMFVARERLAALAAICKA